MSELGPDIERAPFDYDLEYGNEQQTVYTDAGLLNLLYAESPAHLIAADDVKVHVDFTDDTATDAIIAEANADPTTGDAIRELQRRQITTARIAFAYLDGQQQARQPLEALHRSIEKITLYMNNLNPVTDIHRFADAARHLALLQDIESYRTDGIAALEKRAREIEIKQAAPLAFAVQAITRYKYPHSGETEPATD
jgi:hypothetical protein